MFAFIIVNIARPIFWDGILTEVRDGHQFGFETLVPLRPLDSFLGSFQQHHPSEHCAEHFLSDYRCFLSVSRNHGCLPGNDVLQTWSGVPCANGRTPGTHSTEAIDGPEACSRLKILRGHVLGRHLPAFQVTMELRHPHGAQEGRDMAPVQRLPPTEQWYNPRLSPPSSHS